MAELKTVRVGVIGAGGIANGVHFPSLKEIDGVELVAVCDLVEERAAKAAEEYGFASTYVLHPQMLAEEALDAVFVLAEPDRLFRPTLDCLRAGLHVMMEKPPGITTFQAESLLREAREADRICQVGFNRRFAPIVRHIVEFMREHTPITQVEGRFYKHTSAAFVDGCSSSLECDMIHALDAMRWIAGGEPVGAACVEGQFDDVCPNAWGGVCRFDNGVLGIARANYMTGGRTHGLEIHGPGASAFINLGCGGPACEASVLLHGGAGGYSLASTGPGKDDLIEFDGCEIAGSDAFYAYYGYRDEDAHFIECVRENRRPLTDIEEGVKSMKFVDLLRAGRI